MVLQYGQALPVWGHADPQATVEVSFAGQVQSVTADASGKWQLEMQPLSVSTEPQTFQVRSGDEQIAFADVLVGDVWLCSGQSNMERQLGLREGQKPIINWESEAAGAYNPLLRQLYVHQTTSFTPNESVEAEWTLCTPENVVNFSAVAYYFGREVQASEQIPVGIIHSSWGGTPAEAWAGLEGLAGLAPYQSSLDLLATANVDPAKAREEYDAALDQWYRAFDAGYGSWADPQLDDSAWEIMQLPQMWEDAGYPSLDGIAWFRKTFELPAEWQGKDLKLQLSSVDDVDTTYINGQLLGTTEGWNTPREYMIPARLLHPGSNTIACRVLDTMGGGGIWNADLPLRIAPVGGGKPLSLEGNWYFKISRELNDTSAMPISLWQGSNAPTVLFNGMIHPLIPYAIKGAIWYQGESNASRPAEYVDLLPAMIQDWRKRWNSDFPFLFVQIAPFRDQPPEIREAQFTVWQRTPNTALAVTIDCGDADDIHPANKEPVGERLALAARALAYGEAVEYSGPAYASVDFNGAKAVLHFTHLGEGLVAPGGQLYGFTAAGADGVFHPAQAVIEGDTVVVTCPQAGSLQAVRYGWANIASGNLFNRNGLPASPFRTDTPY